MLLDSKEEQSALKEYFRRELRGWSSDNVLLFSTFAISLLNTGESASAIKRKCYDEFPEFLGSRAVSFVNELFHVLETKEFMRYSRDSPGRSRKCSDPSGRTKRSRAESPPSHNKYSKYEYHSSSRDRYSRSPSFSTRRDSPRRIKRSYPEINDRHSHYSNDRYRSRRYDDYSPRSSERYNSDLNEGDGSNREKAREGRDSRYTRDTKEMFVGNNHRANNRNEIQRGNSNPGAVRSSGPLASKSMSAPTCKHFFSKRRLTRIWSM